MDRVGQRAKGTVSPCGTRLGLIICEKLQPFAPALALLASSFQFFTPLATVFAEECGDFGFIFGPVKRLSLIHI